MTPAATSPWRWRIAAWGIIVLAAAYGIVPYAATSWCDPHYFPPFGEGFSLEHETLGGEYFNIAEALAKGRGYSDPFFAETGPTAWMPPLLPTIDAAVYLATGKSRAAVVWFSLVAQVLVLAWVASDIIDWLPCSRSRWLFPTCLAIVLAGNFQHLFQNTHDGWLLLLLAHGCARIAMNGDRSRTRQECGELRGDAASSNGDVRGWLRPEIGWGIWGGLIALASPALLLAWLAATVVSIRTLRWSGTMVACLIAAAIGSPWLVRNAIVFGRVVPIKSNGWFELEQSLGDLDGVLDLTTFAHHPIASPRAKARYIELGEMAFVDERAAAIRNRPAETLRSRWLRHAWNRLLAAFVWKMPLNEHFAAPWFLKAWRFIFAVPTIIVLTALAFGWRLESRQRTLVLFAAAYLLPYVAISFYDRYLIPLTGISVLLTTEAAQHLVKCWTGGDRNAVASSSR